MFVHTICSGEHNVRQLVAIDSVSIYLNFSFVAMCMGKWVYATWERAAICTCTTKKIDIFVLLSAEAHKLEAPKPISLLIQLVFPTGAIQGWDTSYKGNSQNTLIRQFLKLFRSRFQTFFHTLFMAIGRNAVNYVINVCVCHHCGFNHEWYCFSKLLAILLVTSLQPTVTSTTTAAHLYYLEISNLIRVIANHMIHNR